MENKKNKVIAIIPARFNSSRFLGKLLHKIGDKTLLQHTFENAKNCSLLDDIYIATEDDIIFKEATNFKAKCIKTNICSNGTHRIIEVLKKEKVVQDSSIIINLQGDHPKVNPETIEKTIEILKNDPTAVMSTATTKINLQTAKSKNIVKCVFDNFQNAIYFSRSIIPFSKNENIDYYYHIGIYAYRTNFLYQLDKLEDTRLQKLEDLEQLKVLEHGFKMKIAVVDDNPVGVDVFEDVKKVEKLLCQ